MTGININECRLCLNIIHDNNFDKIDEITSQMLNILLLKVNLDKHKESVMCLECATNLQNAIDFKTNCLNTQSKLSPSIDIENDVKPLSKKEILKNNSGLELNDIPKEQKVCQFCNSLTGSGSSAYFQDRKESVFMIDVIQKHIPELHLSLTRERVTCDTCISSLQSISTFIMVCTETEGKIMEKNQKAVTGQFNLKDNKDLPLNYENVADIGENYSSDVEYVNVKNEVECEDCVEMDNLGVNIKSEEIEIKLEEDDCESYQDTTPSPQLMDPQNTETNNTSENPLGINLYKCDMCPYKTEFKGRLKRHDLTHQNPSEVQMYRCEKCSFESKYCGNISRHIMLTHENFPKPNESAMYKCSKCSYVARKKGNLERHQLTHKEPSELEMYNCDVCPFKTKHKCTLKYHIQTHQQLTTYNCDRCGFETNQKRKLAQHMLVHQDSSTVYKCKVCCFETKYKSSIRPHMLTHQDVSSVKMYNCEVCSFGTRIKDLLKKHMLTHKELSEVTVYECEVCPHKTKRKDSLKRHILTHRSPLEVEMYKCESCSFETRYERSLKRHWLTHQGVKKYRIE